MSGSSPAKLRESRLDELLALRDDASEALFSTDSDRIARCCREMSERFDRGGRLLAVAGTDAGRSDAAHVAVEFVHPVIVGKRALPACAVSPDRLGAIRRAEDIVVAFADPPVAGMPEALDRSARAGALTVCFGELDAEWRFEVPSDDPFVRQELAETVYHVLWELVHVFLEHGGRRDPAPGAGRPGGGEGDPTGFLYPFLDEGGADEAGLTEDVAASAAAKGAETARLRRHLLAGGGRKDLVAAAELIGELLESGGTLLAFGNGGSATDAADLVADLAAGSGDGRFFPALDLSAEPAVITAAANDVGVDQVFSRQLIAHGRRGDVAVAISTSGSSPNLLVALREARKRGIATVALSGYDGGAIGRERLADAGIVVPSQEIPRIQEAQATACHAIVDLTGAAP